MSLGDRLREMLDPGNGASTPGGSSHGQAHGQAGPGQARRRNRAQAQPVHPTRMYEAAPRQSQMPRAQWIGLGLAAALAVALTAGLVFVILSIARPSETALAPTPAPVAAGTAASQPGSIAEIFATSTPTIPATPTQVRRDRLQVANTDGQGANLRREPSSDGEKLTTLPDGTAVDVIGPNREAEGLTWRNVQESGGQSGWIAASYLVPEGTAPPPSSAIIEAATPAAASAAPARPTSAPAARPTSATTTGPSSRGQVGNTGGQGANIRSEPGANGKVLKTLAEGSPVDVLGPEREVEGRVWRQVRDSQGVTGWIVGGAVVASGTVPTPLPPGSRPTATAGSGTPSSTTAPQPSGTQAAPATQAPGPTTAPGSSAPSGPTAAPAATNTPDPNLPIIIAPATPRSNSNRPPASPAPR
ncbi:MAG: SH3 domain-containing protein [Chloroflexi bacterium]|nr:SH3 domain-containing protein [Chloroflexota bacterium]